MKDPLGVSPSKGNQGTTGGKEKIFFDLGGNRTHDLRIRSAATSNHLVKARNCLFKWLGDVGFKDEDGYFWILGRTDDIIFVNG